MTWQDRVNDAIRLTSPKGQFFAALWVGNDREKEKALGVFRYPKARGAVVQDLGMGPVADTLTLYFEGMHHDLEAQAFWNACDEVGVWEIQHPTKGAITRQLVRVSEAIQPVTSGGVTAFETEWLEHGIDNAAASIPQLEDEVRDQIDNASAAAAEQLTDKVKVDKPSLLARLKASVATFKKRLAAIQERISEVRMAALSVTDGAAAEIASVAGMVNDLVTTPGLILRDAGARLDYYERVLDDVLPSLLPDRADVGGVNAAAFAELVAAAGICGVAQAAVDAQFASREEATSYLDRAQAVFLRAVHKLDGAQALYAGTAIDKQYFSQTGTFNELAELMRRVRELMLRRSFDLATAKRITLRQDRVPLEIAITEGVDLDVFIASNGLKDHEIMLLPAGRQVVIYG